ncbi:hypothetical protein [Pseudomonas mandelii]
MARTSLRTLCFFTRLGCAKSVREALRETACFAVTVFVTACLGTDIGLSEAIAPSDEFFLWHPKTHGFG